jgi:hypothetical protein
MVSAHLICSRDALTDRTFHGAAGRGRPCEGGGVITGQHDLRAKIDE